MSDYISAIIIFGVFYCTLDVRFNGEYPVGVQLKSLDAVVEVCLVHFNTLSTEMIIDAVSKSIGVCWESQMCLCTCIYSQSSLLRIPVKEVSTNKNSRYKLPLLSNNF